MPSKNIELLAVQQTIQGIEHAVIIPLTNNAQMQFEANFGKSVIGINPFKGNNDVVGNINQLLLRNNGVKDVQFPSVSIGTMVIK